MRVRPFKVSVKVMVRCIDNVFQMIPPDRADLAERATFARSGVVGPIVWAKI